MEIVILGSGTGLPLADRASPSLLMFQATYPVLFDMGPGTLRQLSRIGIRYDKVGRIFITHLHPDHTADLIHFLFATRNPSVLERRHPFTITGPRGLQDLIKGLQEAYGKWLTLPPGLMTVEELDIRTPEKRVYEDFHLLSRHVDHTPQSLAYRVQERSGKSFVYSGDTGFCPEIVELAKGSDLLILECSFPDGEEVEGHLTPSLAGRIAHLAGVKRLVLIHFYPETLATDIVGECRKVYAEELTLGSDFLRLHL